MDATDKSVAAQASCSKLLLHDDTELKKVSEYAANHDGELQKISTDFRKKGYLALVWDSKVPEKDKRFYNFCSVWASNRDDVLAEMRKYIHFYKQMETAVRNVRSEAQGTTAGEEVDSFAIILDLNDKLCEMWKIAKKEKNLTASATLFDLHSSFIQKHEQLENLIKRVECVALKSSMRKTMDGWQTAINDVGDLKDTLGKCENKYDDMCTEFQKVRLETEELKEMNKSLIESNNVLGQNQRLLMEKNERMENQLDSLMDIAQTMIKQQDRLMNENTTLLKLYANRTSGRNNANNEN